MNDDLALVPCDPQQPTLTEVLTILSATFQPVVEAVQRLKAALLDAMAPALEAAGAMVRRLMDASLYALATGKEWHLMLHARKRRTRKKYRNMLLRRLAALREEDDD